MDDKDFGSRDNRGNWAPHKLLEPAPIWLFPPKPKKNFSLDTSIFFSL